MIQINRNNEDCIINNDNDDDDDDDVHYDNQNELMRCMEVELKILMIVLRGY